MSATFSSAETKPCLCLEKSDDAVMKRASVVLASSILFLFVGALFLGCSKESTSNQIQNGASLDDYAVDLLRKKAEAGDSTAQYKLGVMYLFGQGVEKDYVDAYAWFNLSAANGSDDAAWRRDSLVRLLSPQQISDAEKRRKELKKIIAEKQATSQ